MHFIQIKFACKNLIGGNDIPRKEIDTSAYVNNVINDFLPV